MPDNEIYTLKGEYNGKFKLGNNEKIIDENPNVRIYFVMPTWGRTCNENEMLDKGCGKLIKTTKRLIYIREISPAQKFANQPFLPLAIADRIRARKLEKEGIKEYFEVNIKDIIGYNEYNIPLFSKAIVLYIEFTEMWGGEVPIKEYYTLSIKKRYKIIDDPLILKKQLTKYELKDMKKE